MTAQTAPIRPQNYQDILQILPRLPEPDLRMATRALVGTSDLPPELQARRAWLARWQGREHPRVQHPRLALFAANHGVVRLAPPTHPLVESLPRLVDPNGALANQVSAVDADFRLYEMNLAEPSADFALGQPAMTTQTCVQAITYGMMAVDMGLDVLALSVCGDGQELAAATLLAALTNAPLAQSLTDCGADAALAPALQPALDAAAGFPPMALLAQFGNAALAALVGAILASRMAHTPVILADAGGLATLAVIRALDQQAARHAALAGVLAGVPLECDLLRLPISAAANEHAALAGIQLLQQAAQASVLSAH
ncbi:MAG: nicotinate-nucleotide--dimethylbenzimidazole phosphoribosyltransferase [Alphaproteobacteria bacterium]|nr:nicotinate-nucleotide--dimethylbenzimidazole phosphoribosyltransferase [Alphaproteobacteria bacterium]